METKVIIGLDVSKSHLDYVAIDATEKWEAVQRQEVSQLPNEVEAIRDWLARYDPTKCQIIFEPTGTYSDKLMHLILEGGYVCATVTPQRSHAFSQTMRIVGKDDAQAARLLAYMGARLELSPYQPSTAQMAKRKQLLAALAGLMKQHQMASNRLHAHTQYYCPEPAVTEVLKQQIAAIQTGIDALSAQLVALDDRHFLEAKKLAKTVVGIGEVTATWLLIITQGLEHFHSPGQLLKYCGLVGRTHQSGTSVNIRAGITKQACAKLRACLFMAAKSAIRYNLACKDLYERLRAKGKPYFKAMVAVMAKLLKQVFGVVKSQKPFDNDYYLKFQKN